MRILYIDIDTLRPDHLGCYGYHRNTSSNIDTVASEGVRFDNYYASDTPCLPSRAACFHGRLGIHTNIVNHGVRCADPKPIESVREIKDAFTPFARLPAVLKNMGYRTASFSPFAERHGAWWFYDGFIDIHNPGKCGGELAEDVIVPAMDWCTQNAAEPDWFLHVNLWDPHMPYRTPESYGNPFADSPTVDWLTDTMISEHNTLYGPHSARFPHGFGPTPDGFLEQFPRLPGTIANRKDYQQWIDGYDCGIHYADFWIGKLFQKLKQMGLWEETVVIISADHGEAQGELNVYGDHHLADQATHRIPLIIKGPHISAGISNPDMLYNIDLPATLLQLVDSPSVPQFWDGRSFLPALQGRTGCGRDYLVLSHAAWSVSRSVRFANWLMMTVQHDGFKQIIEPLMLFDLETDPHETRNLANTHPEIIRQGKALLQTWHDENMKNASFSEDPHISVLQHFGPYHTRITLLEDFAQTVATYWEPEAASDLRERHQQDLLRYQMHCGQVSQKHYAFFPIESS